MGILWFGIVSIPTHNCCFSYDYIFTNGIIEYFHDFSTCKKIKLERLLIRYLMHFSVPGKPSAQGEDEKRKKKH